MKLLIAITLTLLLSSQPSFGNELNSTECHLKALPDLAQCFSLERLENPKDPNSKTFTLHAARLNALTPSQKSPLVFLAGGPGQSAIEVGGQVGLVLKALLADRDIVFLEQRGTGSSNGFKCEAENEDIYADLFNASISQTLAKTCIENFSGDLSQYNTPNAIDDFAAMVVAMGYGKINLYGGSYGTRAALVFMRAYPDLIDSVVLDSIAPVQTIVGPFASHGYRALNLLFDECEATPTCNNSFPQLRQHYWELWQQVKRAPIDTTIFHPTSLQTQRFQLDTSKLFQLTISNLYSQQQRQLLPIVISQAQQQNYAPLAGLLAAGGDNSIYTGLMANIICNEDIRRATPAQLQQDTNTPFGDVSVKFWQSLCETWPEYRLDDNHYLPVKSDIPVLALSGELDPVTPPAWGNIAVEHLPNATHLIAKNAGHIVGLKGCGPKLVRQFFKPPEPTPRQCRVPSNIADG
ncbi:alpha/beta hydrolase [Simiduia curdlanivorans]|uniref:alpha/beta hydrolase n=1 Tax=Simiduia curdlanivorans TaxID=1492769 RepID=UPI0025B6211B|nr:alpha/beta hydrolase [Simiduia curdlanivorans]MDN3640480.1 alpha/beta hydrolase [Simiduia curdlanivorans]